MKRTSGSDCKKHKKQQPTAAFKTYHSPLFPNQWNQEASVVVMAALLAALLAAVGKQTGQERMVRVQ